MSCNCSIIHLDLSFNKLEGPLPNFQKSPLRYIYLTSNLLSGPIPAWMNIYRAKNIDISYNNFSEISEPSTCQDHFNHFQSTSGHENSSTLSKCLAPCSKDYYSLHIHCGGKETTIGGIKYEEDEKIVGPANLFHNSTNTWGFSNTGHFRNLEKEGTEYIVNNVSKLRMNSELYKTARISPLSLTYFARCLRNGSYTVKLHFAEIVFRNDRSYESVGRRVFDVYVQGKRVLPDFNIKEEAKGVDKEFIKVINKVVVSHNTLEIRLQWTGKGTRNVPKQGKYGSLISAISIVSGEEHLSKNKIIIGLVVAVSAGATLLAVVAFGLHRRKAKRKRTATNNDLIWTSTNLKRGDDQPELHFFDLDSILMATNKFSITNKLGQGGFGPVYKVIWFSTVYIESNTLQ
ncbi:probable leucine-rich repeat receptor-like serine/threonine-protein kinase At3g14840 isoform X2 [Humulus lupulus]|uniref:probable leucine-rich repeat receptor-like serine/threonine-protein kinase At3g14840 isoform X2 n=1 Tax=Humulus lupulus TaxID=3486 RepID=UPI002B400838|nr:probable leucine-rich repeat receptor-like serine/threonine-protein kinase At3g14840 isoform X2 [Humulus lupulus]